MAIAPFFFRKAGEHNLHQVAPLFDAYRQFYNQQSDLPAAEQFLRERLANNESVIYFAISHDQQGVGFTQLYPLFSSVSMKRYWLLNDLFVHPDYRGQGIAGQLIEKAKQLVVETRAKGFLLQTAADNLTAQKLYEKCGLKKETSLFYEWIAG